MERLPAQVSTERLLLRRWLVDDVPALDRAIGASLDHLRPWMAFAALEPLDAEARPDEIVAPAEIGIDCTWFIDRAAWLGL